MEDSLLEGIAILFGISEDEAQKLLCFVQAKTEDSKIDSISTAFIGAFWDKYGRGETDAMLVRD